VPMLTIEPASATLVAGRSLTLATRGAIGVVDWQSTDPSVASVAAGVVTARRPGAVTITARTGAQSATAAVAVQAAAIQITPAAPSVAVRQTVGLTAAVRDATGVDIPNVPVSWTSSDPSIATVDAGGLVTGVAVGTAAVRATAGGVAQSATVTVTSPTPLIAVAPGGVTFVRSLASRQLPGPQGVAVTNAGGGTLARLTLGTIVWRGAEQWLTATLGSGTAPTSLSFTLTSVAATLGVGTYTAVVPVASSLAANSPVSVTVTLTVTR